VKGRDDVVHAAGGVITRESPDGASAAPLEYLVVHRPRYDDWSLPKGKAEPGESLEETARREVAEETGMQVELGEVLPTSEYVDRHGRPKVVHYWRMTAVGTDAFTPNDEVDRTRWITAAEAATLLSYQHDRRLVAAVETMSRGGRP
jgi:8-oxo-dGTP pyrophosphatase MutT (NUDIX family)